MPGGLFPALLMLKDSVIEVMPRFMSSTCSTGESCLTRRFLSTSIAPTHDEGSCAWLYEPNMADGDELEGLLRFRLPDESEDESCVELSGEVEDTAERGILWGRGLCSAFCTPKAPGDPKVTWAGLDMGDDVYSVLRYSL